MTLGDCPIHWTSKLQQEISLSTLKAEYIEYNLDETEGEQMGMKMNADGQTYLLVYGENNFDLTASNEKGENLNWGSIQCRTFVLPW